MYLEPSEPDEKAIILVWTKGCTSRADCLEMLRGVIFCVVVTLEAT